MPRISPTDEGYFNSLLSRYRSGNEADPATLETIQSYADRETPLLAKIRELQASDNGAAKETPKQQLMRGLMGILPMLAGGLVGGPAGGAAAANVGMQMFQQQRERDELNQAKAKRQQLADLADAQGQLQGLRSDYAAQTKEVRDTKYDKRAEEQLAETRRYHGILTKDRDEREGERKDNKFKERVFKYSQAIIKDPVIKKLTEQEINLDAVNHLVAAAKAGNTIASNAMGAKMARAMGEVGVLTASDIKVYVTSGRLDRQAADTLSKWIKGIPQEATLQELTQIAGVLGSQYNGKIQTRTNRYIREFAKSEGMTPQLASEHLQQPYTEDAMPEESSEGPHGPTVQQNGHTYNWNPKTKQYE